MGRYAPVSILSAMILGQAQSSNGQSSAQKCANLSEREAKVVAYLIPEAFQTRARGLAAMFCWTANRALRTRPSREANTCFTSRTQ